MDTINVIRKSASKPSTPKNQVRGAFGKSDDVRKPLLALQEIKTAASVKDYHPLLDIISGKKSDVFAPLRPVRKWEAIGYRAALRPTTLDRELCWAAASCAISAKKISDFSAKRHSFFSALCAQDFDGASNVLDEIEAQCGFSIWGIENRIALLATSKGFEAQKHFVNDFLSKVGRCHIAFLPAISANATSPKFREKTLAIGLWKGLIPGILTDRQEIICCIS